MPSGKGGLTCPWLSWCEASSVMPYVFLKFSWLEPFHFVITSQIAGSSDCELFEFSGVCSRGLRPVPGIWVLPVPNTNPPLSDSGEILEVTVRITHSRHKVFFSEKRSNGFIHTIFSER